MLVDCVQSISETRHVIVFVLHCYSHVNVVVELIDMSLHKRSCSGIMILLKQCCL